jgi:plastocyanin
MTAGIAARDPGVVAPPPRQEPFPMKRLVPALALLVLVLVLAACSGAGTTAAPSGPAASADPNAIQISAKDLKFSTAELVAPADKPFTIAFDNQESAPHNVAIYKDSSASQKLFGEEPVGGPKQVNYQVGALAAGSYFFRCDVHTDMKGTLTVK